MRAIQITELTGPDTALKLVDVPEPLSGSPVTAVWEGLTAGEGSRPARGS